MRRRDDGEVALKPEAVPQPLGRGVGAVQFGCLHDGVHRAPTGHAAQAETRTPLPFPRRPCSSQMPCTRSSASSSAGGTGTAR